MGRSFRSVASGFRCPEWVAAIPIAESSSFDTSAYRQATYGAPDYYCDCTRSLASTTAVDLGTASAGDLVVCQTAWYFSAFSSLTDSAGGNTWTQVGNEETVGLIEGRTYYSALTTGGASFTVTLTVADANAYPGLACSRSNGTTGWTLDRTAVTSTATTATSGTSGVTLPRSSADQWLIGTMFTNYSTCCVALGAGSNIAWVLDAEFENFTADGIPMLIEHVGVASSGTDAATWTSDAAMGSSTRILTFSYETEATAGAVRVRITGGPE